MAKKIEQKWHLTLLKQAQAALFLGLLSGVAWGQDAPVALPAPQINGAWRLSTWQPSGFAQGVLHQARTLNPSVSPAPEAEHRAEVELKATQKLGAVTFQGTATAALRGDEGTGRVNEAHLSGPLTAWGEGWQWSVGKKVVSWDVGYGFRPNDVVQQEQRRSLLPTTLQGRGVLLLEHFDADTAWSFVAVNPQHRRRDIGAAEPALAARVYHRQGAVDGHGFARWGARTGASVGGAVAWVASDALELHASLRHVQHHDTLLNTNANATALLQQNPWQPQRGGSGQQALIGGTWTNEDQLSLLVEAWYDGTAPSKAQWQTWRTRNAGLSTLEANAFIPKTALAGNWAWEASAFSVSNNLHRNNLFARLSWTHENWQPALDVLYHPADRGRILTASLTWQGDRLKIETGWRTHSGPSTAVVRQLPIQRQAYAVATWAF